MACLGIGVPAAANGLQSIHGVIDLLARIEDGQGKPGIVEFDLHHFNLITEYRLGRHWRAWGEIEFEHGPDVHAEQISGRVTLEQGWIEFRKDRHLQIRFGKVLPPFGNYNEIHDRTPVFVPLNLPRSIYSKRTIFRDQPQRLYSKFLTGIQVRLNIDVGHSVLEARGLLGNGRGPNAGGGDMNTNKALAGTIGLRSRDDTYSIGASYYGDRNAVIGNSRQHHAGLHATWRPGLGALRLSGEVAASWLQDPDEASERHPAGTYVLMQYELPGGHIPWMSVGLWRPEHTDADVDERSVSVGHALDLSDPVRIKTELTWVRDGGMANDFRAVYSSITAHF